MEMGEGDLSDFLISKQNTLGGLRVLMVDFRCLIDGLF